MSGGGDARRQTDRTRSGRSKITRNRRITRRNAKIRLRWSDYDGASFSLVQSKGKVRVIVPCSAALQDMLEATPRECPYILARADGRPWFTDKDDKALAKAWCARMEAAGFYPRPFEDLTKAEKAEHLHFHDMRGTAVTLLAEAGATLQKICAVTGHMLTSATRILQKYLCPHFGDVKSRNLGF